MLHGGEDHGINGPHDDDPSYNLSQFHIHAQLSIFVDGEQVAIPTFGGQPGGDSIHTHDNTGLIHFHPVAPRSTFVTLGEVFDAWQVAPQNANPNAILTSSNLMGNVVDQDHYIEMYVNGTRVSALDDYQVHDLDSIVLVYTSNPIVTIHTNLGLIPIELFRDRTPITVANFLNYVNDGDYNNSFFHRYIPDFVMQGGGFRTPTDSFSDPSTVNQFTPVGTDPQIQNEFDNWAKLNGTGASLTGGSAVINLGSNVDLSQIVVGDRVRLNGRTDGLGGSNMFNITAVNDANNTVTVQQTPTGGTASNITWTIFPKVNVTGTIAMAKLGGNPNSATSQFFFNLSDNDANLDLQNGGFTAFGQILDPTVLDEIATLNDLSVFSATLTGAQEVPPVTSAATGSAHLAFNKLNNQFDLRLNVQGIAQNILTDSHIHPGAVGQEGGPIVDLGSGNSYSLVGSDLTRSINNGAFPAANVNQLHNNATYINVHTVANPDGEIRGQLNSVQGGLYSDLPTNSTDQLIVMSAFSGDGEVRGTVFNDADRDGLLDQGETGRTGVTVFADDNQNNQLDSGEKSTTTDASGNYSLRLAPGLHRVRIVNNSGLAQTVPSAAYDVDVEIGGLVTARDFGLFQITAPTGVDLLAVTDSGANDSDNVTNFNNATSNQALQFQVTGVVGGATVRIRADGVVIGEAVVPQGNSTVTVTTNGTTALADGLRNIVATQTITAVTSSESPAVAVTIDTGVPEFTSAPPTTGEVGAALNYNAQNPEEGQTGFVYSMNNAPAGAVINPSTGTLAWTPTSQQTGTHQFEIVATDRAGNTRAQTVSLLVTKTAQARFRLVATDTNGNPLAQINVGSTFQLRAFVSDVRTNVPDTEKGVFTAYHDVTFNGALVNATALTHETTQFGNLATGTLSSGLIDEVGSFSKQISPTGPQELLLYTVTLTAIRSGTLTFFGDAPDLLPAHAFGLFGLDDPLPVDEVDYGQTSIQIINPNFQSGNDVFNFDEDSNNNSLNVLANDQAAPGKTLTIVGVSDPNHGGTVTVVTGGQTLVYTPAPNFFGEETFTYTVSDGADENVASVTVQVHPLNDPPTAVDDTFTIDEDAQNNSLAVLQNDLVAPDAATEKLIVKSVTQPQNGTVTVENTGLVVRFTPAANFFGTTTFTYTIEDDGNPALTSTATVTVNVTAVNDPPVAIRDTFSVQEDSEDNSFDVLANDNSGPETGETLTIVAVQQGNRGGIVTITENGTRISYTPAPNVFGEETFTYTIQDNGTPVASGTATVTVTITGTNDPPNAIDDAINVAKNSQNNLLQVLNNDLIAPDLNETLTITAVSAGSEGGTIQIAEEGKRIRYVPANEFLGTETFTYTVTDPGGLTDTATVTVTVRDFLPSNLSGFVYLDSDNDGVKGRGRTAHFRGADHPDRHGRLRRHALAGGNDRFDGRVPVHEPAAGHLLAQGNPAHGPGE
jgi:cyclophilin family peptidyl-prolyl cis-trans isomerase